MPPKRSLPTLAPKPSKFSETEGSSTAGPSASWAYVDLPPKRPAVGTACNPCRKRKVKCDGERPQCLNCMKRDLECEYVLPPGLKQQQADRNQVEKLKSVIELIRHGSEVETTQAIQMIRASSDVEDTVSSLAAARLLMPPSSFGEPSARQDGAPARYSIHPPRHGEKRGLMSPFDDSDFIFEKRFMIDARDQYVNEDVFLDVSTRNLPLSRWTTASTDDQNMNHLLNLFFTWDNSAAKTFYQPIFEEDLVSMDPSSDGTNGNFCSRFLVNAILATSCLYTMNPVTFKDPGDPQSRGRQWANEAEVLLVEVKKPSVALLQGLFCLFIYEGSIGLGTKSLEYFLRAIDTYKALATLDGPEPQDGTDDGRLQQEKHAMSWCLWAFYCTEWRASHALGFRKLARKPKIYKAWREQDFPLSKPDCTGYWWFPYPMSLKVQKALPVEVRDVELKLSEIAEEILDFIYPEADVPPQANPQRALELYDEVADWKLSCPSRLRFEEAVLPHVLVLHVAAELMLTAVLRPFSQMTKMRFGRFDPRDRCYAHAASMMSAAWSFRAFAQIRFEYWFIHPLGTAAYIVLNEFEDSPIQRETLIRSCQCLHEMRACLPIATDVLGGIRAAFNRYNLQVPGYMQRYFETVQHRKDGLMHYTVASLLPLATEFDGKRDSGRRDLQLQQLLDEFDAVVID